MAYQGNAASRQNLGKTRMNTLRAKLLLKQVPLLMGIPDDFLETLSKSCRFETVSRGEIIIERNDTSRRLFFLLSGQVRMMDVNRQGQEVALAIIDGPCHFGELSVIDGHPRAAAVQATVRCETASISPKDAETLIYNVPQISQRIMQSMASVIRRSNAHRMLLRKPGIADRLAGYLLSLLPSDFVANQTQIKNLPTRYDMGILLGTTRESICRAFTTLEEEGIIKKQGKTLTLTDINKLRKMQDRDD